ncbi:hypothetical protein [Ancylobacter pratisalsi]|uniref:Uncharacterized protein n=1 Tax=Ancylobacter pratisalsi TaxID=1745854 RepID=A0A6P1YKR7_9HYPH|nr:hypothetical protein [Ancylobacter pratisalsi]QIB33928.1 hypothetical protein G3A50_09555 [Ancylobacter pratisalsi]
MPPVFVLALGAFSAAALVKLLAKEARRVNAELDASRREEEAVRDDARPSLRRDPLTGEYHPGEH